MRVRCGGPWAKLKLNSLAGYLHRFVVALHGKKDESAPGGYRRKPWDLHYLDLFSGPGLVFIRSSGDIIWASPFCALQAAKSFDGYHFMESDARILRILEQRANSWAASGDETRRERLQRCHFYHGDCNEMVNGVLRAIPEDSKLLAFIDPTGIQIKFSTIRALATRSCDLLITFQLPLGLLRNLPQAFRGMNRAAAEFFGDTAWKREIMDALNKGLDWRPALVQEYRKRLAALGYLHTFASDALGSDLLPVKTPRGLLLYYLLLASKDPLAQKFWQQVQQWGGGGQRTLPWGTARLV